MTDEQAGMKLASLGAVFYQDMELSRRLEAEEDFQAMMYHLNKLAYRLVHGKELG